MPPRVARASHRLQGRCVQKAWTSSKAALMPNALSRVKHLFNLYGSGAYTIGEPMTILAHSAQAAARARAAGERDAVVVAALFHDIGHMLGFEAGFKAEMDGCGFEAHHESGSALLKDLGFHDDVAFLTAQHVAAKRYKVAVDPDYAAQLSEASKTTLRFQGGPMSAAEVAACEADPRWPEVLRLRTYDEDAKRKDEYAGTPIENVVNEHSSAIERCFEATEASPFASSYVLSSEQLRKWDRDGALHLRRPDPNLNGTALDEMASFVAAKHALIPGRLIHHELPVNGGPAQICRVENFCKHEPRWNQLGFGLILDLVSQLYREDAVLFKDKLNYKGPGGAGFLWHQDATAYKAEDLASQHISALVAIDKSTVENGALQIAAGAHNDGVFPNDRGVIRPDIARKLKVEYVLANPGDIFLFDSFLPHKSDSNRTSGWRRSAYLTYNKASEGDFHAAYYRKKAEVMKRGSISINEDFAGKIVD